MKVNQPSVWDDPENAKFARAMLYPDAKVEDFIAYAKLELRDCQDSLEPSAPGNGHAVDGFHAGCCAMRALSALTLVERKLGK